MENSHWKRIVYIGGGSYERCYQCMDLKTGKLFAIKCVRENLDVEWITSDQFSVGSV